MTNPIEVAARALIPYSGASTNRELQARKTFESIDVDDLEGVIRKVMLRGAIVADVDLPTYIAHAVKAHLTGKEHTMNIPQAAVDAARQVLLNEGCLDQEHYPGYRDAVVTAALEAAIPELRKQIMRDIREAVAKNEATPKISQYRDGITDGLMCAHRLVEKGLTK